jgi:DNA-binding NarL/FixJ family response regulator
VASPLRWDDRAVTSVVIVDDDAVFRALARRVLAAAGLVVIGEAEGVRAALATTRALRPDAVLVDVRLPDGDGIALAGELTRLDWEPCVVLTSVDASAADADEVRVSRATAFVPKSDLPSAPLHRLLTSC